MDGLTFGVICFDEENRWDGRYSEAMRAFFEYVFRSYADITVYVAGRQQFVDRAAAMINGCRQLSYRVKAVSVLLAGPSFVGARRRGDAFDRVEQVADFSAAAESIKKCDNLLLCCGNASNARFAAVKELCGRRGIGYIVCGC